MLKIDDIKHLLYERVVLNFKDDYNNISLCDRPTTYILNKITTNTKYDEERLWLYGIHYSGHTTGLTFEHPYNINSILSIEKYKPDIKNIIIFRVKNLMLHLIFIYLNIS